MVVFGRCLADGVAVEGSALYVTGNENGSVVRVSSIYVLNNTAPAIQTAGNASLRLDQACFAENGLGQVRRGRGRE